jgi:hypothetical protein
LESGRRITDCDLLAFSISFETDYLNLIRMLELAGLPARSAERGPEHPLVVAGGPAIFLNPEPIAELVDCFLIGEGEEMLPEFLAAWTAAGESDRETLLAALSASVPGVYVPGTSRPSTRAVARSGSRTTVADRRASSGGSSGISTATRRRRACSATGGVSAIWCSSRRAAAASGAAGSAPPATCTGRSAPAIPSDSPKTSPPGSTSGAPSGSSAPRWRACRASTGSPSSPRRATARLSPSSLKADCVTPRLAAALAAGGARSVTVAPEAGSERMRRVINKNLSEADILRAAALMAGEGVQQLKLYFMIGLPTERPTRTCSPSPRSPSASASASRRRAQAPGRQRHHLAERVRAQTVDARSSGIRWSRSRACEARANACAMRRGASRT